MNIAITGSSGFIGRHLLTKLDSLNIKYTVLDRKKCNLLDSKSLRNFVLNKEVVVHLAGANRDTDFNLVKVNTLGTMGLLEAMTQYGKKGAKIVLASSFQVYKPILTQDFIDEKVLPLPASTYSFSKLFAEQLVAHYNQRHGLKGVVFRMANVYGPGGKPFYNSVIATFVHLIKSGRPITIHGNGSQARDFIFVGDAVRAFLKAIDYELDGIEVFNICSGKLFSLKEIVGLLQQLMGNKKLKVSYEKAKEERLEFIKGDNSRAKKLLNWSPQVNFKAGLERTLYGERT